MSFQNRYSFSHAAKEDAHGIKELFEAQSFEGNIGVQFLRGEDPVSSLLREGEAVCLVLRDNEQDKIIGMGGCVIRQGFIGGEQKNIGYLTGLKLLPQYHKKFPGIAAAYRWIADNTKQVDYYYTTILSENTYVHKMLEKRRKNMPIYHYLGDYRTFIFKSGGKKRILKGLTFGRCTEKEALEFYHEKAAKHEFSVLSPLQNDLQNASFFALYKDKNPIAIAYALDQREYKQYIIRSYGGIVKLLRYLLTGVFGYPKFPKKNQTVGIASAGIYLGQQTKKEEIDFLLDRLLVDYTDTDMVMIGAHSNHPLFETLSKRRHIAYDARLYQVSFNTDESDLLDIDCTAAIEVAFQ